jgi:hypothetical protein
VTGQQSAVLWMGFLLIIVRLFTTSQWPELKQIFGLGPGPVTPASNSGDSSNPVSRAITDLGTAGHAEGNVHHAIDNVGHALTHVDPLNFLGPF